MSRLIWRNLFLSLWLFALVLLNFPMMIFYYLMLVLWSSGALLMVGGVNGMYLNPHVWLFVVLFLAFLCAFGFFCINCTSCIRFHNNNNNNNNNNSNRHHALNDLIARSFASAGVPVTKEPIGLFRSDGKRPEWSHTRSVAKRQVVVLGRHSILPSGWVMSLKPPVRQGRQQNWRPLARR